MSETDAEATGEHARDGVHEWYVNFYGFGDEILYFTKHGEVILGFDVLGVGGIETSNETTERGDTNALPNSENS